MDKLQFEFILNPKAGHCVASITTESGQSYMIPEELQPVNLHEEILKTSAYEKIKNSLKKPNQSIRVWIKLSPDMRKAYVDDEGNMQFSDLFLEEDIHGKSPGEKVRTKPSNFETRLVASIMPSIMHKVIIGLESEPEIESESSESADEPDA